MQSKIREIHSRKPNEQVTQVLEEVTRLNQSGEVIDLTVIANLPEHRFFNISTSTNNRMELGGQLMAQAMKIMGYLRRDEVGAE